MKIQLESGPSSSATHSLTQPSTTLNRRYVSRPTTLAIEEAARNARRRELEEATTSAPSRLVNLRLREADLIASHIADSEKQNEAITMAPSEEPSISSSQAEEISEYTLPEADDQMLVIRDQIAAELAESTPLEPVPIPDSSVDAPTPYDPETSALALNIAADYTAASLGAAASTSSDRLEETDKLSAAIYAAHNTNPIDEVAKAATSAITAVRTATTPEEIADRLESLRQFADQIKQDTSIPEMAELSNTLQNFINIAEKSTGIKAAAKLNRAASKAEKSTAKIIKAAPTTAKVDTAKVSTPATPRKVVLGHTAAKRPAVRPAMKVTTSSRQQKRTVSRPSSRPTPRVDHSPSTRNTREEEALRRTMRSVATEKSNIKAAHRAVHRRGRVKRFALAFGVSTACVAAIAYFVTTNIPDISVRVAAMQTGVEASYPSYVPSDFSLDNIDSGDGKIILTFKTTSGRSFSLIEEKSSWDSAALQRNYVQETWKDNYTTTHEQGITIFINEANAAWVNGGVLYKINADPGVLTKKQLRNIVTSM